MSIMAVQPSQEQQEFAARYSTDPNYIRGLIRDNKARATFYCGLEMYNLYDQGSLAVIKARADHAPALQGPSQRP